MDLRKLQQQLDALIHNFPPQQMPHALAHVFRLLEDLKLMQVM